MACCMHRIGVLDIGQLLRLSLRMLIIVDNHVYSEHSDDSRLQTAYSRNIKQ